MDFPQVLPSEICYSSPASHWKTPSIYNLLFRLTQCPTPQVEVSTGQVGVLEYAKNCPKGGKARGEMVPIPTQLFTVPSPRLHTPAPAIPAARARSLRTSLHHTRHLRLLLRRRNRRRCISNCRLCRSNKLVQQPRGSSGGDRQS